MIKTLKYYLQSFADLFIPNLCEVCDSNLISGENIICTACRVKIPVTNYWNTPNNPVIQSFWGRVDIDKACSYFFFIKGSKYRKLLHKLKYQGKKEIGTQLGLLFGYELERSGWSEGFTVIVPVPLHLKKQYKRGYNQSECIARGLSDALKLPVVTDNLIKSSATESQIQKNRLERWNNVHGTFWVLKPEIFAGKHILLVDDTLTTGATLEACATTLLASCNCKISIATLAYAPLQT